MMATPSARSATGSHGTAASTSDALHDFLVTSCTSHEPRLARACPAVALDVAPPPVGHEFAREQALGFLFADEMKVVRQLQLQYEQGRALFTKVYFARGCAGAIPPAPPAATDAAEVAKLLRYYGGVYDVLQPQVAKLRTLCDFCSQTVGMLSDTIQRIAAQENTHRVIPDVLLDGILDVMDVVLQMNQLHDTKSSLRNDFSLFKRAFKHVQGDISEPDTVAREIQRLQEFVGTTAQSKNSIWDSLRHNLMSVKRYTHVVFLLVKQCHGHLESGRCLQPHEKFKYIRLLPCLMAVLNADPIDGNLSGFQSAEKRLIEATGKYVGRFPVVPIFADLCVKPMAPVWELGLKAKSDHAAGFERNKDPAYDVSNVATQAKKDAAEFIPRLMFAINKMYKVGTKTSDDTLPESISRLTIEGIRYLSRWKTSIGLFLSAKYQRPKSDDQLEHMGVSLESPYIEYQRVITHNFDREECSAVMDIVHTIKQVGSIFRQNLAGITTILRGYLYSFIQEFIQRTLVAIMHRAEKKKHPSLKIFQELRLSCGDWLRDESPSDDYKRRRKDRQLPEVKRRVVSPSRSQIQMLRTAVYAIYAKRTIGDLDSKTSVFAFHRELKSTDIEKLQEFYTHTADFGTLLDFDLILKDLCSFPTILYRELFLEITKSPQLPVDDSLPWLILNRSFAEGHGQLNVVPILSLLDIYNDALAFVLTTSEQVALCHEIVAEAKLFFDNAIYKIANSVFSAAKSNLARSFLGPERLRGLSSFNGSANQCNKSSNFDIILSLRAVKQIRQASFLGQLEDIMLLVSGHLNARLVRDLSSIASRISRPEVTIYVAVGDLIHVLRRTHRLLAEHFSIEPFEALWQEATTKIRWPDSNDLRPPMNGKRLQRMVWSAVTQDLAVKFGFNERTQRFYRTPLPLELRSFLMKASTSDSEIGLSLRVSATSSSKKLLDGAGLDRECRVGFDLVHQSYRSFVGIEHVKAMVSLLSPRDVVEVVDDCLELVVTQIKEVVHLFVPVLGAAIPPYRLPRLLYRTEGCYGYFESKFRHMMESKELEVQVYHSLRVIGNSLLTIHFLDQVMAADNTFANSRGLFVRALEKLHAFFLESNLTHQWGADAFSNPEQTDKNTSTFFLVWNALEYLSCCPPRHGAAACYRETFGDGVSFAGCTFLHLLGQRSYHETWNPSQHVLDAHAYDKTKKFASTAIQHASKGKGQPMGLNPAGATSPQAVGNVDSEMAAHTKHFLTQASQLRVTTRHYFSLLENAWSAPKRPGQQQRIEFTASS